ncbi:ATP-dependent DNA helicase srs2 [Leucoagaricus gongylophorus]
MIKFISANAHVVEAGTFPFYRSEDAEEERRLLYVACTRAQCLLYLSYTERRKIAGEAKNKTLSPFLTSIRQSLFTNTLPDLDFSQCRTISQILGRAEPPEEQVRFQIAQYAKKYTVHSAAGFSQPAIQLGRIEPSQFTTGFVSSSRVKGPTQLATQSSSSMIYTVRESRSGSTATNVKGSVPLSEPAKQLPERSQPLQSSTQANLINNQVSLHVEEGPKPSPLGTISVKRRLGMGWGTSGYVNKKFKPP